MHVTTEYGLSELFDALLKNCVWIFFLAWESRFFSLTFVYLGRRKEKKNPMSLNRKCAVAWHTGLLNGFD